MTNTISTFANKLNRVYNRYGSTFIKSVAGGSIRNNRTPSVRQMITFLTGHPATQYRALGKRLEAVYDEFRNDLRVVRSLYTSRTDATDIKEVIYMLEGISICEDSELKAEVRNILVG